MADRDAELAALREQVQSLTRERDHWRDKALTFPIDGHPELRQLWSEVAQQEADGNGVRTLEIMSLRERANAAESLVAELVAVARAADDLMRSLGSGELASIKATQRLETALSALSPEARKLIGGEK